MPKPTIKIRSLSRKLKLARGVSANPVPPSSRAGMGGTAKGAVQRAAILYESFSGQDAYDLGRVKVPPLPKVGVAIGEVDGILYSTIRDGRLEKYIHKFHKADRPLLVVDSTGKCLYLLGGNYEFTERGIVDRSDKSE